LTGRGCEDILRKYYGWQANKLKMEMWAKNLKGK
jgi:hypothetical protein